MPSRLSLVIFNLTAALLVATIFSSTARAERRPVLDQIDVPHDYYFREMYLPQLTNGPGSLAWTPEGETLIYSMQGSLWQQRTDSNVAVQLTQGPGYDFQPDVAPDGTQLVFVRYLADAMELYTLQLDTGVISALTSGGAVNVEPRWSPDGQQLAFVTTQQTGRFHVVVGGFSEGKLSATPLLDERESVIGRYYYSSFDHQLSPVWAPDGQSIFYIGNREVPYGSGSIMQVGLHADAVPKLIRKEETSWRARPDIAPDGRRIAYASYLGRQWHQLWVTHADGVAEPFPLTYGDYDITAPRWSPDGSQIAYVANEKGDTEIRVQQIVGGSTQPLTVSQRKFLAPMHELKLRVVDQRGKPVAARVALVASDGRSYAPLNSWMHADDSYDRASGKFETKYFHTDGQAMVQLPAGAATLTVWRGLEHDIERRTLNITAEGDNAITIKLTPLSLPKDWRNWDSGDVHVHMNYGGTYRSTPATLMAQARAEDLDVVFNLIVNKEQRIPDIGYFSTTPDKASDDDVLLMHAQEFHTSFWGHLGLLGLDSHLLLPDYSAYPATAAASVYPDNATIARLAHKQQAVVGYVHPFLSPPPDPAKDTTLTNALPVDAALGLVNYYETVGFADHHASAEVWYRLLNCGARIAAAGGTDAMANYASLHGPIGINRTYVRVPGKRGTPVKRHNAWLAALKAGTSMATNGPLLGLTVNKKHPGDTLELDGEKQEVNFAGYLRSALPIDHLELVYNGSVIKTFELDDGQTTADISGTVPIDRTGWLLLRAWNDTSHADVFDIYPYATTSPVYVSVNGLRSQSKNDAEYFLQWLTNIRHAVTARDDYNSPGELRSIIANLDQAQAHYEACR